MAVGRSPRLAFSARLSGNKTDTQREHASFNDYAEGDITDTIHREQEPSKGRQLLKNKIWLYDHTEPFV